MITVELAYELNIRAQTSATVFRYMKGGLMGR